jgi:hypothetical protein
VLEILEPGAFSGQLHLFVDDHGTRTVIITVHGIAQ